MRSIWVIVMAIGCNQGDDTQRAVAELQAAGSALAKELNKPVVTGKLQSTGGELGTFEVVLGDCQSGELHGFFGADFLVAGTTRLRLRYVHDEAAGDVVKVFFPDKPDTVRVFDRNDHCAVLTGSVEKQNVSTRVAGKGYIRHVAGHVKFDCSYDNGGHVTADVTFSGCH